MSDTSTTFGGWSDRLTYIMAEGQILVAGLLLSVGAALIIFRPSLPGVPPIVVGWFAVLLLFGPALFGFFVLLIKALRQRMMIEVGHVNARQDILKKYYVSPEIWKEKTVDGPAPYPVNGGSTWAVQDFEYLEDMDELRVEGVWLSECEDTKLYTKKSHMEAIYGKLTESHITLNIMRDSINELGADIQRKIINATSEARERGTMIDKTAVKSVFEDFEKDVEGTTDSDLPNIEVEEVADDAIPDEPSSSMDVGMGNSGSQEAVADD